MGTAGKHLLIVNLVLYQLVQMEYKMEQKQELIVEVHVQLVQLLHLRIVQEDLQFAQMPL